MGGSESIYSLEGPKKQLMTELLRIPFAFIAKQNLQLKLS